MTIEILALLVAGMLMIAGAAVAGPRLGIAAPILQVAMGVAASFVPTLAVIRVDPEIVLEGILPPLLYAAAVSVPTMNFRREFSAISGLSVLLVIGTSLGLGLFFWLIIPEMGFALGVALGAIISPTDAVAISIIRKSPVSKRVIALLDGESLLNDASALVLLRAMIVATATAFSYWGAIGTFVYSVTLALVCGGAVGFMSLAVRSRITEPTVNTLLSFTVPFVAAIPTTLLGGSGLVAAVVAGLWTSIRAPRLLPPRNRLSDVENWRTVELVLEGTVFLIMGLQLRTIVGEVQAEVAGVWLAILIAVGALALTILLRAAFVAPLLGLIRLRAGSNEKLRQHLDDLQERLTTPEGRQETANQMTARWRKLHRYSAEEIRGNLERFSQRIQMGISDLEYFSKQPLGWRDGAIVVWAGMRGAVTVAAAQTLPEDTPLRPMLVFIAFVVALLSLLIQGGTIGLLVRALSPRNVDPAQAAAENAERTELSSLLRRSADMVAKPSDSAPSGQTFASAVDYRLAVLDAQRAALLDARDYGAFDADLLAQELANLDAIQITIEMRRDSALAPSTAAGPAASGDTTSDETGRDSGYQRP